MFTLDHDLLTEDETRKLVAAYQRGDLSAAERIIAHNERAIYRVAQRYHSTGVCADVPLEDLQQWGRIGLLHAIGAFDLKAENRFMTYAWNWIREYISRNGKREGQRLSFSYRAAEHRGVVGRERARFEQKNHRTPNNEELAAITGFTPEYVSSLRAMVESLDSPLGEDDDLTLGDVIAARETPVADNVETKVLAEVVQKRIAELPAHLRKVVVRYYGLDGKPPADLKTLAKSMRVSRERVRQYREQAIATLRRLEG